MRTTLTRDPDVAERVRRETASGRLSLKKAINERLRMGYGIRPAGRKSAFRVIPHSSAYRPGVDPLKLNQLLDEPDAEAFVASRRGRSVRR